MNEIVHCKACQNVAIKPLNNKELCNACFLKEANQRLLYAISVEPDADLMTWVNWWFRHYTEHHEEWG